MHPALDRDVWVCDRCGKQLANGTEVEGILRCYPSSPFDNVLQLLEEGVLQDRIDHQDESRKYTGEEGPNTLLLDDIYQCSQSGLGFFRRGSGERLLRFGFAGSHAGVYDPDRVGDQDRSASC